MSSSVPSVVKGGFPTEVVEGSGSILVRNIKIEPSEKEPQFELRATVAVSRYE
jgi:hypothetical protein